jgi:predicted dehydrogenase
MLKAAIIGLGWWGQHIIRQMRGSGAMTIALAVGSREEHRAVAQAHQLDFTTDFDRAMGDPSIGVVILATPHALHAQQIRAAAHAGKHVFCEKPVALTVVDAVQALQACKAAGVRLGVGHERRFEPAMDVVRDLLKSEALGTVMHIEAAFSHDKLRALPQDNWRVARGGEPPLAMTATGIHLTDLFIDLLGPMERVFAFSTSRVAFPGNGDVLSAHIHFASGATGYLNTVLVTPFDSRLAVYGSEAWVEVRDSSHPDQPGSSILTLQRRDGKRTSRELEWKDTVRANLEMFARSIEGEVSYPFTDHQIIHNISVLVAINESLRAERSVRIASGADRFPYTNAGST